MVALSEESIEIATKGNLEGLRKALAASPDLAFRRGPGEETLLHIVARQWPKLPNGAEIAQLLLDRGAEVNAQDDSGLRPIQGATGDLALTRTLLEAGAETAVYAATHMNMSPAEVCLYYGLPAEAALLVSFGAPVDLRIASGLGDMTRLDGYLSLEKPALTKAIGLPGQPGPKLTLEEGLLQALGYAARNGQVAAVEKLLDFGAEIDGLLPYFNVGCTALHQAVEGKHADVIELLIARGARLDVRDDTYGSTPCGWAKEQGSEELVAIFEKARD